MKKLAALSCIFFSLLIYSSAMGAGKVLLVHSYYSDYPWVNDITAGVKQGLKESKAELEIFYMDTKRKTSEEWKIQSGILAKQKVDKFKPDIIIPADDNAQQYFGKNYIGNKNIKIVFTGVNADPSKYGYPADNATGVIQKPIFIQSIELLLRIKPNAKKIAVISDDGPTSDAILSYIKTLSPPVKVLSYDQPSTFDEWKKLIINYQTSVDAVVVNLYQTIKEKTGATSLPQKTIMDWTMANNKLPTIGLFPDAFDDGILCGIAESGHEQGYQAGKIAVQILQGKKPSELPIITPTKGLVILNLKTAEKLGISIPFDLIESANRVIE